jgi:short-subunit dehydrogenase
MTDLNGKTILITGASKGIGNALTKKLAAEGARIVMIARSGHILKEIAQNLPGGTERHEYYECDLSDSGQVEVLVKSLKKDFKVIDVLINCAGIGVYKSLEELTIPDWDNSFNLNVRSAFLMTKGLEPLLFKSNISLVMNIGSGAGTIPMKGRSVYCATKFALRGFTLSLAEEFEGTKTNIVLITLGSTLTGFGPLTIEEKKEQNLNGKAYFTVDWVSENLTKIIKSEKREKEYVLFPGEYGLGSWEKP